MSYSQAMNGVLFTMASGPYKSSKRRHHCLWTELINKRLGEESSHAKRLTACRVMQYRHGHMRRYFKLEGHRGSSAEHCIHKCTEFLQLLISWECVCVPVKGAAYQGELPGRGNTDTEILKGKPWTKRLGDKRKKASGTAGVKAQRHKRVWHFKRYS